MSPKAECFLRSTVEPTLVALIALIIYGVSGARDILWGDPGKLTIYLDPLRLSLEQAVHVGALLWAKLFVLVLSLEPYAWRAHISSAVATALAIGATHAWLLGRFRPAAARVGTAAVAFAHTIWLVAAMMESYAPALAAVACGLWLGFTRRLPFAAGIAIGVGTLANPLVLFPVPAAVVAWGFDREGLRKSLAGVLGLVIGWGVPAAMVLAAGEGPAQGNGGLDWGEVLGRYVAGSYVPKNGLLLLGYLLYNLPGPALLLVATGFHRIAPRGWAVVAALLAAHYGFAVFYLPQRAYLIPLPLYLLAGWPVARAAGEWIGDSHRRGKLLLAGVLAAPLVVYWLAPRIVTTIGVQPFVRTAPYRGEWRYYLSPWKAGAEGARRYIQAVGVHAPDDALLIGDFTIAMPFLYAQRFEGWRPDLRVIQVDDYPGERICEPLMRARATGRPIIVLDDESFYPLGLLREFGRLTPLEGVASAHQVAAASGARACGQMLNDG